MKRAGTLLLTLILSGFSALRCGATTYQSDGSAASVQGLHNAIRNGDTITLPSGTFAWSSGVTITKTITLQGAGTSATGGGDQTSIVDNYAANQPLIRFTLGRITGLTVQSGTGSLKDGGTINISGAPGNVRIDHCHLHRHFKRELQDDRLLGRYSWRSGPLHPGFHGPQCSLFLQRAKRRGGYCG